MRRGITWRVTAACSDLDGGGGPGGGVWSVRGGRRVRMVTGRAARAWSGRRGGVRGILDGGPDGSGPGRARTWSAGRVHPGARLRRRAGSALEYSPVECLTYPCALCRAGLRPW